MKINQKDIVSILGNLVRNPAFIENLQKRNAAYGFASAREIAQEVFHVCNNLESLVDDDAPDSPATDREEEKAPDSF
jgi:hypothetical protein